MSTDPLSLVGQLVGNIRVVELLGRGGMGAVYVGFDETLQRRVALKVIRSEYRLNPDAKARFLREARILSQLDHPHICRVHDYLVGDDHDFLVLELVPGRNLRAAMKEGVGEADRLQIATQLLDVLQNVHARGVVHRDLKPENVMLTPAGAVKVLDFGLARSAGEEGGVVDERSLVLAEAQDEVSEEADRDTIPCAGEMDEAETRAGDDVAGDDGDDKAGDTVAGDTIGRGRTLPVAGRPGSGQGSGSGRSVYVRTTQGVVLGTAGYMSPEQARGEPSSAASDIYSLGLILQELFTGSPPYERGLGREAVLRRAARAQTLPVTGLAPDLTALINRLKSPEPASRPSSVDAAELLQAICDAPRRRRRRRLIAAAWLVVTLFGTVMAVQAYRLAQARQREQLASSFGAQVQRMESLMRFAHLAPLSSLEDDTVRVHRRIAHIREQMAAVGDWGRGPGLYAIGRGHLALGHYAEARSHLEQAWQLGYQGPEVAYALGLTLGNLYETALDRLRSISEAEERRVEQERIERQLRDPAVAYLGLATGLDTVAPEYVRGLLALYEGRYDDALSLARDCTAAADWFYECHFLAGAAWYYQAADQYERGELEQALQGFERADAAYSAGVGIGQSDPAGYGGVCRVRSLILKMRLYDIGGDLLSLAERAIAACDQALVADPAWIEALEVKSNCYRQLAESRLRADQDPEEALLHARQAAQRMVEIDPDSARSHHTLAITLMFSAAAAATRQQGGLAEAAAGVAALERAAAIDGSDAGIQLDLGNAHHWHGEIIGQHGEDPVPSLQQAAVAFRRALQLKPKYAEAYNNLAAVDLRLAELALAGNGDPTPNLDEAIAQCRQALDLKPDHMFAVANLGIAHLRRGQHEVATGRDPSGSFAEARTALSRAVELNSDHLTNYLYLAEVARDLARYRRQRGEPAAEIVAEGLQAAASAFARFPGWPQMTPLQQELLALAKE